MNREFLKEGFKYEAKFGLLRQAVMKIPEIAGFSVYRGEKKYEGLKKSVKDFLNGQFTYID